MSSNHNGTGGGQLSKSLGLFRLTIYGIGTIIGSGIYAVISPAAQSAGANLWISFILAAVISSFTALSYAELSSSLPSAGAEHNFLRKAFPKTPALAFIVGLFIAIHGAATIAAVALTFSDYLMQFMKLPSLAVAFGIIILFTATNIIGLKKASWVNVSFTVIQILCLFALIVAGFSSDNFIPNINEVLKSPINWEGSIKATAIVFFIYTGYEHMASLSEEAKDPGKDLWKAFLLALVITTAVYIGVMLSVLTLLDVSKIASSSGSLSVAAQQRWSSLGTAVGIAALLATANGVLSGSISVSRLLFGMARTGDLPKPLISTTSNTKSPWVAAIMVMLAACGLVYVGKLEFVASLSSFGALLVFTMINLAVIMLRIREPKLSRPFKIPGSLGKIPMLSCFGVLFSVWLATRYQANVYGTFLIGLVLGGAFYGLNRGHSSSVKGEGK